MRFNFYEVKDAGHEHVGPKVCVTELIFHKE